MPMPSLVLAAALAGASLPPVHVALTFGMPSTIPPAIATAAVREAAAIWSEHRVVVDLALPCASEPDEAIVLTIQRGYGQGPTAANAKVALGAIAFAKDGTPYSFVTVFFDRLLRSIKNERLGDVAQERWPPDLRERVIGRALGRVIAHEIGHYLLGTRAHSSSGLMRSVQPFAELFALGNAGFLLSRDDEQRLARRIGQ
jgi:hypothetical protein